MLESLFDNVAELQPCNLFKETPTQAFSCEVWEIFRTPILKNLCERLPVSRFSSSVLNVRTSFLTLHAERQVTC